MTNDRPDVFIIVLEVDIKKYTTQQKMETWSIFIYVHANVITLYTTPVIACCRCFFSFFSFLYSASFRYKQVRQHSVVIKMLLNAGL